MNFKIDIPPVGVKNDLTIIYKDGNNQLYELKTPKDEFLKSLRYFQRQSNEINRNNIIYIQENVKFDIFENFVSSICSKQILLNEENYEIYYKLSYKYEYDELTKQIEYFISTRPDIFSIVKELEENINDQTEKDKTTNDPTTFSREEIVAKNLDICIKNGILKKLPIEILNRILNSPKRVIKDHHLLFSFVFNYLKENMVKLQNDEENEHLLILTSCLDYNEMTNDEIEQLFNEEKSSLFFSPRGASEKMKKFVSNEKIMNQKISELEERLKSIEMQMSEINQKVENSQNQMMKAYDQKLNEILQTINKNQQDLGQQLKLNESKIEAIEKKEQSNQKEKVALRSQLQAHEEKISKIALDIQRKDQEIKQQVQTANIISCEQGVFKYLFNKCKANPVSQGLVNISGNCGDSQIEYLQKIIDSSWTDNNWVSKDVENSYINIEFKTIAVKIVKYRLLVGWKNGDAYFSSWVITGITDDNKEIVLDDVSNSSDITEIHPETTKQIQNQFFIRSVKIMMKGKRYKYNDYHMCVRNIELYGSIKEIK